MSNPLSTPFLYILFNKPYDVLSQFTREAGHVSLRDFGPFPRGVYPVGRLDADSEGLLLLTNDNHVKHRLSTPHFKHPRTYLVQVEGTATSEALDVLRSGLMVDGRMTLPADVRRLQGEPTLPPRVVPIRYRASIPTSWLEITLTEGRNRQVRRMTAAVGFPTLRLVRTGISTLVIGNLEPGRWRELTQKEVVLLKSSVMDSPRGPKSKNPR
ncbi:MAG: pseudouridine synthase [Bacteroidota bacterium]